MGSMFFHGVLWYFGGEDARTYVRRANPQQFYSFVDMNVKKLSAAR
jgi:hypothetical protein